MRGKNDSYAGKEAWVSVRLLSRKNLGFLIGLLGLTAATSEFIFSDLLVSISSLVLAVLWVGYLFFGLDVRARSQGMSVVLGLIFLTLPPLYIGSYDSVTRVRADVVDPTRQFSPSNDSVTITFTYRIFSSFNWLPVTVPDITFDLYDSRYNPVEASALVKGGTLQPFGQLAYNLTFVVPSAYVNVFRGNITSLNMFPEHVERFSSIFYSTNSFMGGLEYWDWSRNIPCSTSRSDVPRAIPGPGITGYVLCGAG